MAERIPDLQLAAITDVIAAGPSQKSTHAMHTAAKTLLDEVLRLRAKYAEREMRCEICDWPLARTAAEGCVPGNCSFRPPEGSEDYQRLKARRAELRDGNWITDIIERKFGDIISTSTEIMRHRAFTAAEEIKSRLNISIGQIRRALDAL